MTLGFPLADERELALRSTRLLGESGLSLSFDPDLHYDILDCLDDEDFNEVILMCFRGMGKTTAIAAWLARKIAKNRDFRALVFSVEDQKAAEIVDMTRSFLESEQMEAWFGPFKNQRQWSADEFTVLGRSRGFREATLTAAGIYTYRAGGHYNVIVKDDLLDDKNTKDAEKMEDVVRRETLLVPMCDVGEALMVTAGTFWDDADLNMQKIKTYGLVEVVKDEHGGTNNRMRNNAVSVTKIAGMGDYKVRLFYKPIEDENGQPCYPRTHPASTIARIKMTMRLTPEVYAAQYKLDPMPTENAKFRPEDFIFMDAVPKDVRGDLWIGMDFASSLKAGSDYTAWAVALITSDFKWFVLEAGREKMDGNQAIEKIFDLDRAYPGARFAIEEDRYYAGLRIAFEERCHALRNFPQIDYINAHSRLKKEVRIEALQGIFRAKSVVFISGATELLYQPLRRWPKGKRDVPDAFANIYDLAASAPPDQMPVVKEDDGRFLDVRRVSRSRLGDSEQDVYNVGRVKRLKAEEVPWRML